MLLKSYTHDPEAVLDYYVDWGPWLAGDTLASSGWVATGTVTIRDSSITGDLTGIWVEDPAPGQLIDLTNHITTTEGREEDATLRLKVRQ